MPDQNNNQNPNPSGGNQFVSQEVVPPVTGGVNDPITANTGNPSQASTAATQATGDPSFGINSSVPPMVTPAGSYDNAPKRGISKVIPAILGLLFLVGAVTAGILLVQQQQEIREHASSADQFCGGVSGGNTCTNDDWCWVATATNMCLVNGQPEGSEEFFAGNGEFDGQVCYTCTSSDTVTVDNPGSVICSAGNKIGGNNAKCPGGSTTPPPPGPNPPPPPPSGPVGCANTCQTDADCGTSTMGIQPVCNQTTKMCVNPLCPNNTTFGNRCDCGGNTQTCGNPCGNGYPLCASGSICRYLTPSCVSSTVSAPTTFCVPTTAPTGWTTAGCSNDVGNSYVLFNSQNPTLTQLQQACNPVVVDEPTAQCLTVTVYDANHVAIATADLPKLKAGDVVYLGVQGSLTGAGSLDRARFTVNTVLQPETTTHLQVTDAVLPNGFQMQYTVPANVTQFNLKGELHHSTLGWF